MNDSLDKNISASMLIKFSLPTIISLTFIGIYTNVDGIFVSRLIGTDALSAVNIIKPIIGFSQAVGTMFGTGGSAIVAKKIGEGKKEEARKNFSIINVAALLISLLSVFLGLLFINPIISFLGADENLFSYCYEYAVITMIIIPFSIFSMVFQMFFIVVDKANYGLLLSVFGGIINIILDYIFIAVFDIGIRGAAVATCIGYFLQTVTGFLYFLLNRKGSLFFEKPKFDMRVILESCINGSSEMIVSMSIGIVTVLFNKILMDLEGSNGVAAITIILYAHGVLYSIFAGYSSGTAPIISYNYGKQDTDRLKKIYSISKKIILISSVITYILSILFSNELVSIFVSEGTEVYEMAVHGYKVFSICFLFLGINIYSSTMFTAYSNGKVSAIISIMRTFVFVVISVLLMPLIIGINGVWLSIPIAEMLSLIITVYYFTKFKHVYKYA